mmetsp:Transcript_100964/g.324121  ORF Transcript_100964/g.324121 Transcript_100964/m.324121 type:complete len:224 (+) Transcript_100964:384-1055(+)
MHKLSMHKRGICPRRLELGSACGQNRGNRAGSHEAPGGAAVAAGGLRRRVPRETRRGRRRLRRASRLVEPGAARVPARAHVARARSGAEIPLPHAIPRASIVILRLAGGSAVQTQHGYRGLLGLRSRCQVLGGGPEVALPPRLARARGRVRGPPPKVLHLRGRQRGGRRRGREALKHLHTRFGAIPSCKRVVQIQPWLGRPHVVLGAWRGERRRHRRQVALET